MAEDGLLRSRETRGTRRSRRLDTRFLRRLGAQLHVLRCQWPQLDRALLRNFRQSLSRNKRAHLIGFPNLSRVVSAKSPARKSEVVVAQQRESATKRSALGARLHGAACRGVSEQFLFEEQTRRRQGGHGRPRRLGHTQRRPPAGSCSAACPSPAKAGRRSA